MADFKVTDVETAEVTNKTGLKPFPCNDNGLIEESTKNGLSWEIHFSTKLASFDSFKKIDRCLYILWCFQWDEAELKSQGYDGYMGEVVVVYRNLHNQTVRLPYQVELIHSGHWIQRRIGTDDETKYAEARYVAHRFFAIEFSLRKFTFEAKSAPSNFNDSVLIVEGRKIDVNKKYLSMHSEYFDKLFNSGLKKKSISVDDVKYADFSRLLNTIHPMRPVLPTDETMEVLLILAEQFMFPVVTERVINHLRYSSDLSLEGFLRITDKYKLHKLWELILKPINSGQRMQLLVKNINYENLSETARLKLFSHFAKTMEQCQFSK